MENKRVRVKTNLSARWDDERSPFKAESLSNTEAYALSWSCNDGNFGVPASLKQYKTETTLNLQQWSRQVDGTKINTQIYVETDDRWWESRISESDLGICGGFTKQPAVSRGCDRGSRQLMMTGNELETGSVVWNWINVCAILGKSR